MVTDRMILTREMMEETRRDFGEAVTVYQTTIPRTSQFGRAKKAQQSIFEFAPRGKSAAAMQLFCQEFIAEEGYEDGKAG